MFGIDFPELVVIGVVALVVLGPERLPKAARFIGLWVRRARAQWTSVKSELERELAAEEFRRTLTDTQQAMRDIDADVRHADAEARREFDALRKSTSTTARAAVPPADATSTPGASGSAAPEPFDSLADFDPNAVEPLIAPPPVPTPRAPDPSAGEHVIGTDSDTATETSAADTSAPTPAPAAPPPPTSAFAAAAAALGRQRADAELSVAAVMTGPNPSAATLEDAARDPVDDAAVDVTLMAIGGDVQRPLRADTDHALPSNDRDAARARDDWAT